MSRRFIAVPAWRLGDTRSSRRAFTLIELLVVLAIIGILAAIALPKLGGFGKSNSGQAAIRQLLDDVAQARGFAISSRSDVYIVFVPPEIANWMVAPAFDSLVYTNTERTVFTNLASGQYTTYALFAYRAVGEQPGQRHPRYLTPWKTLPEGTFIAAYKYIYDTQPTPPPGYANGVPPFATNSFPFPLATSPGANLPYIAFDYQGRLRDQRDEILPLASGSIFYPRGDNGVLAAPFTADWAEIPPTNSIILSNHVRIDWLTGRAHVERQELQ